jgi:GT2 family glycosyltransferase
MDKPFDISVVIVTYKSRAYISRCLQSIRQSAQGISVEIIIVDNSSQDGLIDLVRAEFPEVFVIENKKNEGFARGVNQGASIASGRYLNILNPDTQLYPETLKVLLNFMEKHPRDCVVGARLVDEKGNILPNCRSLPHIGNLLKYPMAVLLRGRKLKKPRRHLLDLWEQNQTLDITKYNGYITGASIFTNLDFFKNMGMFDEQYFVGAEDADFGFRIDLAGFPAFLVADALLVHSEGGSASQNPRSRLYAVDAYLRYIQKNFTLFHGMAYKLCFFILALSWTAKAFLKGRWEQTPILWQTLKCFTSNWLSGPPILPELSE